MYFHVSSKTQCLIVEVNIQLELSYLAIWRRINFMDLLSSLLTFVYVCQKQNVTRLNLQRFGYPCITLRFSFSSYFRVKIVLDILIKVNKRTHMTRIQGLELLCSLELELLCLPDIELELFSFRIGVRITNVARHEIRISIRITSLSL